MPRTTFGTRLARAVTLVIWPMARMLSLAICSAGRVLNRDSDPAAAGIVEADRKSRRRPAQ